MALSELNLFFRQCLYRRVGADRLVLLLQQYRHQNPVSSKEITATFLSISIFFCTESDPLLQHYLQNLLISKSVHILDFATALAVQWEVLRKRARPSVLNKIVTVYARMVTYLDMVITSPNSLTQSEYRQCALVAVKWLVSLTKWAAESNKDGVNNLTQAVGFLLISCLSASPDMLVSGQGSTTPNLVYKLVQTALDQCMDTYPAISMQLMNKLGAVPNPLFNGQGQSADTTSPYMMDIAAAEFDANIREVQIDPHKATTAAVINHLLRTGSTVDDSALYTFLHTRHESNHGAMFNELAFAAIDALVKNVDRNDALYLSQWQTFIMNKLPQTLAHIVTSAFGSFSSADILSEVWTHVAAQDDAALSAVVRGFLTICTFHHLIPGETVTSIAGEDGTTKLKGLYAKDDLVNQVAMNPSRGPRLVEELLKKDGNAGSIALAISEIMHNYSQVKDTHHLKDLAHTIVRKPHAINTISMFLRPDIFLRPLCNLLDAWKWDEIHGESQPVYDEFGSILLLVAAFKNRLNLQDSELGIQQREGFVARYLVLNDREQSFSSLPEVSQKHIEDWIKSLYIDEGLSDELTTNCSAQDFYLLVPTLLRQILIAHAEGRLNVEAMRAGLEFLREPFLLPALLSAFAWVRNIADTDTDSAILILKALSKGPGSKEAYEIHQTILSISRDRLSLGGRSQNQSYQEAIAPILKLDRFTIADSTSSSPAAEGSLIASLKHEITNQLTGSNSGYDARVMMSTIEDQGPLQTTQAVLELLVQATDSPTQFNGLLDFTAALAASVCPSMRTCIQVFHTRLGKYLRNDKNTLAKAIVHLDRRVELYSTVLSAQDVGIDQDFTQLTGISIANVNLDSTTAPTFENSETMQQEDIDQVLNEAAVMSSLDQVDTSNFDDMYGLPGDGLGLGIDDLDLDMF